MSTIKQVTIQTPLGETISQNIGADALNIDYDNSSSELESTNVQDAIDELKDDLSNFSSTLENLDDVNLSNLQNEQVIKYNSTSQKWENGNVNISGKADKVSNATNGNFASLDANGNLTDSGKKASDFAGTGTATSSANGLMSSTDKTKLDNLGTASTKDVPTSGNAGSTQVVMGNDTRLSDNRKASDVYDWAKAATKPQYTASEVGAIASTAKGANNGVAELDSTGKVPSSQLPSFVDDVLEYDSLSAFPTTGEAGKIYIAEDTNKTYRWSGTAYTEISASLALGETSSTAYRGDRGKTAYDHSQSTHARTDATKVEASSTNGKIKINGTETTVYTHPGSGTNPHGTTKSDVGLGNVGNFKAVSTVASQGLSDTEKSNARANINAGTSNFSGNYNDLTNKPTIPTVNNATLTIQKNGSNVQTFTANQASNATANITVPTKVSELTNDSGYTTNTGTITGITMNGSSKGTNGVVDLGTVITSHQDISGKLDKVTYEYNKEISFSSTGFLKIGSFPMYDSAIVIDIDATTSQTYHGTVVIASQNVSTSSIGSAHTVSVYDDPSGIIANSLRVTWASGSRNYNVFFVPQSYSKNLIHIRACTLPAAPTDICISQTGTVPTTTSGLEPTNVLNTKADKSATVSNIAWDSTNKKLTKTINGTTSDVVTGTNPHGTTKSDIGLGNVENKSSATIRGELTSSNVTTALGFTPGTGTVTSVKVGSTSYSPSSGVISLPAYPTDTNTHRPISVNGTQILGNDTTTLNLKQGSNVTITNSGGEVTINASGGTNLQNFADGTGTGAVRENSISRNVASGQYSHAEGNGTTAEGTNSHAEGESTRVSNLNSHAEGGFTLASGDNSHAEGYSTRASGSCSHAEGFNTSAYGGGSHAEGYSTSQNYIEASGIGSHAEGYSTSARIRAIGHGSHAEGSGTTASGYSSHAEGYGTYASGNYSHAEGFNTKASGLRSHAEGSSTTASGELSHTEGVATIAGYTYQHVSGKFNSNKSTTLFEIGNGAALTSRSNAFEVYSDGNLSTDNGTTKVKLENLALKSQIPSVPSAASSAPGDITTGTASAGSSGNYARQDHTHKIATATTSAYGATKLNSATNSTSTTEAATPSAVKAAYDLASSKGTGTVTQVKIGSTAYNPSSGVISLPAYPTDTNTHRPIQVNGTEILGNNTTALNLKAGSNVTLTNSSGTVTIAATDTNTWRGIQNNLTSDSTTDSLSAAQGKALKASVDAKMDKSNPTGTGSFSLNRLSGATIGLCSFAEGYHTEAIGNYSHAEGAETTAYGSYSHAEGKQTSALGNGSHAEGYSTCIGYIVASGLGSHAEGYTTSTSGKTIASGLGSHAEGISTSATNDGAHTEGELTLASAPDSHAEGSYTYASGVFSHAEGNDTTASNRASHAEGNKTLASNSYSHAEGNETCAISLQSHAEGLQTRASGSSSHAEGQQTTASGDYSHTEGNAVCASGTCSHAEGSRTTATGNFGSHAEGYQTCASGISSHVEGYQTLTNDSYSHAEGYRTTASGINSHAEGYYTCAYNYYSHSAGYKGATYSNTNYYRDTTTISAKSIKFAFGTDAETSPTSSDFIDPNSNNAFSIDQQGSIFAKGAMGISRGYINGTLVANGPRIVLEDGASYILYTDTRNKSTGAWRGAQAYYIAGSWNPLGTGSSTTALAVPHAASIGAVGSCGVKLQLDTVSYTNNGTKYRGQLGIGSCGTAYGVRWNLVKVVGSDADFGY